MKSKQMESGKAFEYALLIEFKEKLEKKTKVEVVDNSSLVIAKKCFDFFVVISQSQYILSASFAVNFLIDIEPRLSNSLSNNDVLQLEILSDLRGKSGDVRDVLAIRLNQEWEIGISAKNNHNAVKHSRLSSNIDFGEKWVEENCSTEYFEEINPIFSKLNQIKIESNSKAKWNDINEKDKVIYKPLLEAFKRELLRLHSTNQIKIANNLIKHLVGNQDFYKVIKRKNHVDIIAYNLYGTLNLPFKKIESKYKTPITKLPSEIIDVSFKKNSNTTIIVELNNEWKLSFRIHNASSKVEPSLKFDIKLLSSPKTLFKNTLSIPKEEVE